MASFALSEIELKMFRFVEIKLEMQDEAPREHELVLYR
jgi:hypothetical protein